MGAGRATDVTPRARMGKNCKTPALASPASDVSVAYTVTAYNYCPYSAIYGAPDLPVEATPEVENARKQLADKYQELLKDHETVLQTLAQSLSDTRRQQLTQLSTQLETDAEMARQTGENCLNDTSNCPQQAAQVLAGLKVYDQAALYPNPADGWVAFLPLDGNTEDATGNGHDGMAFQIVPTTDILQPLIT